MRSIKTIIRARKKHQCSYCSCFINKTDTYFSFQILSKTTRYPHTNHIPTNPEWPKKCCFDCYRDQKPLFLALDLSTIPFVLYKKKDKKK